MKVDNTVSKAIEICLRIFGIWPNTSCALLCRLFWIGSLVIEQAFQYRYIVVHFYLIEFSDRMKMLGAVITYSILLMKLVIFLYKQRTFNRILTMMANDWEECSNTKFSMLTTKCNAKLSQRVANTTVILYSTSAIFFSSKILVKHADGGIGSNVSTRLLILDMDLPFDTNRRFVYESVIIVQFFYLLVCSNAMGLLNALLINLFISSCDAFRILKDSVQHKFNLEHIEDLYSYIAMALFVSDTLVICCLGFSIVASLGRPDALKNIINNLVFYFVMNMEAFIYCFAGEYLSAKSKSIGDAGYGSLWYESSSIDCRIILLLIMRSQNQLAITIGKIMNLSLEQFSSILKASASYMSVLFAMY
ncbi:uncharacterized protein [Temnothorax longispinosus]|uniref:uncharacterized protein isoform X3 n=1 Tax=Temnothorax longispinosus TaxID=300112 RepID=UPI003A99434F